jgi:hypothetical protein
MKLCCHSTYTQTSRTLETSEKYSYKNRKCSFVQQFLKLKSARDKRKIVLLNSYYCQHQACKYHKSIQHPGLFPCYVGSKQTLLNPGSMLPERTTTTGDSLPVKTINPFHMINAEVTIIPAKRNIWKLKPSSWDSCCTVKYQIAGNFLQTDIHTTLTLLNITILQTWIAISDN